MCFGFHSWPQRPTLLSGYSHLDFNNQSEWGVDDWRYYAKYLEESGKALSLELAKTKNDLYLAQKKASRRSKPIKYRKGSLLTGFEAEPKNKPGPKEDDSLQSLELARLVIQKRICDPSIKNDKQALKLIYDEKGFNRHRNKTATVSKKTVLNQVAALRKQSRSF